MVLNDMKAKLDPSQFAGQKGLSCEHYLLKLVDRILKALDYSDRQQRNAILITLLDWESAFNKVDHNLGMQAFIDCGVRPSLLPLIANYFEERSMTG